MPLAFLRRDAPAAPEERVVVRVPKLAPFEALVSRVVDGGAELALTTSPGVPVRLLHHKPAIVEPPAGDERLSGTLLGVAGLQGRMREDVLHFLHPTASEREAQTPEQRRSFARIETVLPVTMVPARFKVGWLDGATRNVSAGGMLVTGAGRLGEGERLRLLVELAADDVLDLSARVVRSDEQGLAGLRLERLSQAERDRVARWITARERESLARLKDR
jgi:hypothetical protein